MIASMGQKLKPRKGWRNRIAGLAELPLGRGKVRKPSQRASMRVSVLLVPDEFALFRAYLERNGLDQARLLRKLLRSVIPEIRERA